MLSSTSISVKLVLLFAAAGSVSSIELASPPGIGACGEDDGCAGCAFDGEGRVVTGGDCSWNGDECFRDDGLSHCQLEHPGEPGDGGDGDETDPCRESNVSIPPGCDPESVDPATSGCFDRHADVFGLKVWAAPDVPGWALAYAASLVAEYLDADEDGAADDPKIVDALVRGDGRARDAAVLVCRGSIGTGRLKDLFWSVTRTHGQSRLDELNDRGVNEFQRVTMEESHHLYHRAAAEVYPQVFGGGRTSDLSLGIDQAYGDCEYADACAPNCQHYDCVCEREQDGETCDGVGDYRCTWIEDSCRGVYHYGEVLGCDTAVEGGGCQGSEGYYWPSTTLLGWHDDDAAYREIKNEWEVRTAAELATDPSTRLLYLLVSGQAPSQAVYGYRNPSRLPDGKYRSAGRELTCDLFFEKAGCEGRGGCAWRRVEGGLSTCVDAPACPDGAGTFRPKSKGAKNAKHCKHAKGFRARKENVFGNARH